MHFENKEDRKQEAGGIEIERRMEKAFDWIGEVRRGGRGFRGEG